MSSNTTQGPFSTRRTLTRLRSWPGRTDDGGPTGCDLDENACLPLSAGTLPGCVARKPMRIIVAYAAGGANDLLARVFSERSCRPSDRRVRLPV
jgi:hypothetical protein